MSQAQKHRGGQTHGLLGMASELRLPWPEKVVLGGIITKEEAGRLQSLSFPGSMRG